jgi:hypothetical protein
MTARGLSGVIPKMINTGRDELRHALARRTAAENALESARQASAKGRELIEKITRQAEDIEADSMREAEKIAVEMKAAILSGGAPSMAANDRGTAKNVASRAEFDARRQAAEQVVADLAAEEREREREVSDATVAVEQAVQDVLRTEAEKIAANWEELELKARAIRIRLGGLSGDPIWRVSGLSDRVGRALYLNREDREFDRPESEITRDLWIEFGAALVHDPDAQLTFTASERAIEKRAERQAADERYIASLRGEAA